MTTPTLTDPPTSPSRGQTPSAYVTNWNAWLAWMPGFVTQLTDAIAWIVEQVAAVLAAATTATSAASEAAAASAIAISSAGYAGTSATPNTIGTGAKSFHMDQVGLLFADDMFIVAFSASNPDNRLYGNATAWDGVDDITIDVPVGGTSGAGGPYDDWIVAAAGFLQPGADAADMLLGTSDVAPLTPASIYDALAEVTLTDAATIAVDMSTFINAKVTLGGNRTLGNPSNAKPGQTGRIRAIQDGTGSRTLSFASNWKRQNGAPTLTTTAAAYDVIEYDVIATNIILYDLIKNPT